MFVVDSAIFQKEVRDVAEFLYVLLTDTVICRNVPALLVACNKQGAVKKSPVTYMLPPCLHFQPKPEGVFRTVTHWFISFTDITMAKSAKLIQQQLEKEL